MKVPYAYIVIGDVVYFQAQNYKEPTSTPLSIGRNGDYDVVSQGRPQLSDDRLYVNGGNYGRNCDIVPIPFIQFRTFLRIIKEHNARLNNV